MRQAAFSACHPLVNAIYFGAAIVFAMVFAHPAYIAISCLCSALYLVSVRGRGALRLMIPMAVLFAVIAFANPLFNTGGTHILFTWPGGRPYTLEALCYGLAAGGIFVSVIFWFAGLSGTMDSGKCLYLFAPLAPSVSLAVNMALRFVPLYRRKLAQIMEGRQAIGLAGRGKRGLLSGGMTGLSSLMSWALESGISTADSMKCRGYGSGKRSTFSIYRMGRSDKILLCLMSALIILVTVCAARGACFASYMPDIRMAGQTRPLFYPALSAYTLFLILPTAINISEEAQWRYLRSKI